MTRQPTRRTVLTALAGAPLILGLTGCLPRSEAETDPVDGQARIRLAMLQPPRSGLTPFSDDAFKLSRWSTAETLVVLDEQGDPLPGLAVSWERTDPRTWRFTLREGVLFHDGTRMDAQAVRTALQAGIDAAPKPRILDGVQLSVRALDEHTVEVVSRDEDPLIPGRLSSPQLAILSPNAYAGPTVDPKGTGTGPFVLAEVNGTSSVRLERFEDYWGPTAKAPGIDVSFVPDGTARGAALRTGEADLVEAIPVSQVQLLDPGLVHEVPMPRTCTLYVNVASPVLRDPGLRAAVREAVDRDALVAPSTRATPTPPRGCSAPPCRGPPPCGRTRAGTPRPVPTGRSWCWAPSPIAPSCPRRPWPCSSSWRRPGSGCARTCASTPTSRRTGWPGPSTSSSSPGPPCWTPGTPWPTWSRTSAPRAPSTSPSSRTRRWTRPCARPPRHRWGSGVVEPSWPPSGRCWPPTPRSPCCTSA